MQSKVVPAVRYKPTVLLWTTRTCRMAGGNASDGIEVIHSLNLSSVFSGVRPSQIRSKAGIQEGAR
jgi:hypothetical protein